MGQSRRKETVKSQVPSGAIRLFIADDEPLFLLGLQTFLERQGSIRIVGKATNAEALLRRARRAQPSLILLDMSTARQNDFEVLRQLRSLCPEAKILLFIGYANPQDLVKAIQAGALGCLHKESEPSLILQAIQTVQKGKPWFQREFTEGLFQAISLTDHSPYAPSVVLSRREQEMLQCLAQGMSNKEIANRFHLSVGTVKAHLSHLFRKLNLRNRKEAVHYALRHSLM